MKIAIYLTLLFLIGYFIGVYAGRTQQYESDLSDAQVKIDNLNYQLKQCIMLYKGL